MIRYALVYLRGSVQVIEWNKGEQLKYRPYELTICDLIGEKLRDYQNKLCHRFDARLTGHWTGLFSETPFLPSVCFYDEKKAMEAADWLNAVIVARKLLKIV